MNGNRDNHIIGGARTKTGQERIDQPDRPLVSVITITRNNRRQLEETIQSVLGQDYPNIEYIIIDGGSKDGSVETIREYEGRIDYFCSEPDNGIYDAINKGIGQARGSIINFLNSGDYYADTDIVSRYVEIFLRRPEINMVFANARMINDDGTDFIEDGRSKLLIGGSYCGRLYFCHQTVFYHRSLHDRLGPYTTDRHKVLADYYWWMRGYYQGVIKLDKLDAFTIMYRAGGPSMHLKAIRDQKRIEDEFLGRSLDSELLHARNVLLYFLRRSEPGRIILKGLRRIKHAVVGRPGNRGPTLP